MLILTNAIFPITPMANMTTSVNKNDQSSDTICKISINSSILWNEFNLLLIPKQYDITIILKLDH